MEICAGPIVNSGEQRVDKGKFDAIMSSAETRLSAFIPSETVRFSYKKKIKNFNGM